MKGKTQNMTLQDYAEEKKRSWPKFKNEVCSALRISEKTFYNRFRNNSWTPLERSFLSEKTGISEENLFPKTEKVA